MPDVRTCMQANCCSWKHVNGTIFLHVASIIDNYFSPIAANGSTRTDVNIFADDDIAGNSSLRMNKRSFLDDGTIAVEFVNHNRRYEDVPKTKGFYILH